MENREYMEERTSEYQKICSHFCRLDDLGQKPLQVLCQFSHESLTNAALQIAKVPCIYKIMWYIELIT